MVGGQNGPPSSAFRISADDHRWFTRPRAVLAAMNQVPGHHPPPVTHASLQGAQLPLGELAGILLVEPLQQRPGGSVRLLLEPQEDLRPHFLKGVLARPPGARLRSILPMSR